MKLNKISVALGFCMVIMAGSTVVNAATAATSTDNTHVYFHGTITEAPCSLDPTTVDQTVEMGHIAAHLLENEGSSDPKPFNFKLTNCDITNQKTVTVTFGGAADPNKSSLLSLGSGDASGAGIAILANGSDVTLGTPTTAQNLSDSDNNLTFSAYLKGDGASAVTPGEFNATSNVTFTYQ